jgi:hypothetical protein
MIAALTEALLIAATLLHGFLAGGNIERALVHMPAWRKRPFEGFERWGNVRGVFHVLAFVANGWALAILARGVCVLLGCKA